MIPIDSLVTVQETSTGRVEVGHDPLFVSRVYSVCSVDLASLLIRNT